MSLDCNIPTPCTNPLVFLIKEVFGKVSDGVSVAASLDTILDSGISITSSSKFCCPDCNTPHGFYYLGLVNPFLDLIELEGLGNTAPTNSVDSNNGVQFDINRRYRCCVNYQLPIERRIGYFQAFKPDVDQLEINLSFDKTPSCCSTDFSDAVQELVLITGADNAVIQAGLIEASTFNGKSGLGIMLKFLKTISPALSKSDLSAFFIQLLSRGVVVVCDECTTFIMTVQQYDMYLISKQ